MHKKKWTTRKIIVTTWKVLGISFLIWQFYSFQSHGVDGQLLENSDRVLVEEHDDYYRFTPTKPPENIFIFYPGALVSPKAYVPLCREIAEHGVQTYIIKMPWRMATRGYNKIKDLHLLDDTTKTYILSGHSQGGKMAAQFVYENPGLVDKLVLIGTTHPRDYSMADRDIPVLKIYGSNDGVADEKSILQNKPKLPADAKMVRIAGANHAQFGYYGYQLGDNKAGISRAQQLAETSETILAFIFH